MTDASGLGLSRTSGRAIELQGQDWIWLVFRQNLRTAAPGAMEILVSWNNWEKAGATPLVEWHWTFCDSIIRLGQ